MENCPGTKDEAMFLSIMCNNASPMFVIGYIVLSELQVKHIELPMIIILYSSAIISACIFRSYNTRFKYKLAAQKLKLSYSLGTVNAQSLDSSEPELDLNTRRTRFDFSVIDSSIMSGFEVITKVGGYIILFSILTEIILSIPVIPSLLKYLLVGICEITTGINTYACSTLPEQIKIILILSITSFGGLSGLAQTKSVFGESGLSIRTYSKAKLLSMLITCVLTIAYVML